MDHLLILAFACIALIGTWTAMAARREYENHGVEVFRRLFHYLVGFNLLVLGYLVAKYVYTNLVGENPFDYPPLLHAALSLVVFSVESFVAWSAVLLGWGLRERRPPPPVTRILVVFICLVGISYVVSITLLFQGGALTWLASTHFAMGSMMLLAVGLTLAGVVFGRPADLDQSRRRSARALGGYLLIGYLVLAATVRLGDPGHLVASAGAFLWLNVGPWIWLRRQSGPYRRSPDPDVVTDVINALGIKHGITQREREIMRLIVQGKSNKEIEAELHISFSTVKNHAYNLYRKLGVKSRAQLMQLVMSGLGRTAGGGAAGRG